jgi:hypothetical protein
MGLQEEIKNLVSQERVRLEARDVKHKQYYSEQEQRFAVMKRLLYDIVNAFSAEYIQETISVDSATVAVGWNSPENGSFETKILWKIKPQSRFRAEAGPGEALLEGVPGFTIDETSFRAYEVSESKKCFANEEETANYLIHEISEQVAAFEHIRHKSASKLNTPKPT